MSISEIPHGPDELLTTPPTGVFGHILPLSARVPEVKPTNGNGHIDTNAAQIVPETVEQNKEPEPIPVFVGVDSGASLRQRRRARYSSRGRR